jgi:hypothetical protein
VGNGDKAIIYLGKYLYKGVIQEKNILKCENGMVTFRYIHSKSKRIQTRTVPGEYFLWLLIQHQQEQNKERPVALFPALNLSSRQACR